MLVTVGKAARFHSLRRLHRLHRLFGVGQVHRSVLRSEEAGGGKGLELLLFSHTLEPLPNIDEGRDDLVLGTQRFGHPCTDVRGGHGQGRNVTGVPVVLVPGMKDRAQVRLHGRTDQRTPVHDMGDVFQAIGNL